VRLPTVGPVTDNLEQKQSVMGVKDCKGFSLVEMAMVLALVSSILALLVSGVGSFREQARYAETNLYLEEAKAALLSYALTHGYLPCPDTDDNGEQDTRLISEGAICARNRGNLPWIDLGLNEMTPWNARVFYAINQSVNDSICTDAGQSVCYFENEKAPAFDLQTPPRAVTTGNGNLTIRDQASVDVAEVIARDVIAVIGSYGENSFATNSNCSSTTADETENCDIDANFVMNVRQSRENAFFDDQLVWIHSNTLKGQMRDAGLL